MAVYAPCFACKRPFLFHPDLVPSIPIDPTNGLPADMGGDPAKVEREPICRSCVQEANANRLAAGRELIVVAPGAYLEEG